MFRQIFLALAAFIVLALLGMWLLGGGPRRTLESIRSISLTNPISPDPEAGFQLPWQPAQLFPTIDLPGMMTVDSQSPRSPEEEFADIEAEYYRIEAAARDSRGFGNPSPYANDVYLVEDTFGVRESEASREYIQIASGFRASSAVDIAGWSLESALTGTRVYIPPGASPFVMGAANTIGSVALEPGGLAIIVSAPSPVGVSFRENLCTGYLGQFQSFDPPLSNRCPSPSSALPLTQENLQRYGESCFDAIASLASCEFPQNLSTTVSPACRAFLTDALSYNGCVNQNRFRAGFNENTWRIFLGASGELWRNSHDAIRLLDAQGRTVDVLTY